MKTKKLDSVLKKSSIFIYNLKEWGRLWPLVLYSLLTMNSILCAELKRCARINAMD
jgi:hypothetical protein